MDVLWIQSSSQVTQNVKLSIDTHLNAVMFAAQFVPLGDIVLSNRLLHYFSHHDQYSGYRYSSMGVLTLAANTTDGKWSWQVANYPQACPSEPYYGYFYSDDSIHPAFYGYCAFSNLSTVDWSTRTYSGYDWGLFKPTEVQLVVDETLDESFKPIFDLLNNPTLTYEVVRPPLFSQQQQQLPETSGRYVTFAELQLRSLSDFIKQNISVWNGQGAVYIAETQSHQVIAPTTQQSLVSILSQWSFVTSLRIQRTGLDWTIYVGVPDIYADMYYKIAVAAVICTFIVIILSVLSMLITHFWISKPLQQRMKKNPVDEKTTFTPFSDFN